MIIVKFKNLDRSDLAIETVRTRVGALVEKFPDLQKSKIQVTLEMENSPVQAGPDSFTVKLHITRGRYDGLTIEKTNDNLYHALAELVDYMLESLNRFGDKARIKERTLARQIGLR